MKHKSELPKTQPRSLRSIAEQKSEAANFPDAVEEQRPVYTDVAEAARPGPAAELPKQSPPFQKR